VLMALTREISVTFNQCELTHVSRVPIDLERARAQHDRYEWALVEAGCTVRRLPSGADMPDAVFIEDTAVAFDEGVVVTRPGAQTRRTETPQVIRALARYGQPLRHITAPGTLDGGDVLVTGRHVFVGFSTRTNRSGVEQLTEILEPLGYDVRTVPVRGCLHLKSAVTAVSATTLLVNRSWVPVEVFEGFTLLDVDPREPHAANALTVGDVVIYPSTFPRTGARLDAAGLRVRLVDTDELEKAEGAVTCCSLIFEV
jgi:dimethylargininase